MPSKKAKSLGNYPRNIRSLKGSRLFELDKGETFSITCSSEFCEGGLDSGEGVGG